MKDSQPPRLVLLKDALKYGGWSRSRAYELLAAGKITAFKDGGRLLICLDSIDAYRRSLPRFVSRMHHPRRR